MDLAFRALDTSDTDARERFCAAWNSAWPDDPLAPVELAWEIDIEPRAHRWIVEGAQVDGDPLGVAHVERIRWNEDDAPPIAWIGLVADARSDAAYRGCLAACARAASEWGFDELRVSCWEDDEDLLIGLLEQSCYECREREVHVALDVNGAGWAGAAAGALPDGIRITTLADEPQLAEAAWACFSAAPADVPGDEPVAVMSFDSWLRERTAPWARDEACFLAVTDRDDVV
ncbi:MAG: hypothetical protein JWM86_2447, partial [Thermoleophilia bacterium]|nr:hypothetical protein [Thermoleophilia bacterium]